MIGLNSATNMYEIATLLNVSLLSLTEPYSCEDFFSVQEEM